MIGLITALPQRYESRALMNILHLILHLNWTHPIEIWEAGEEISAETRQKLEAISHVRFRNTLEFDDRIEEWRGFQIKAPALLKSSFEHSIWCDSDSILYQNPSCLLESEGYRRTGSYMFRDLDCWKFSNLCETAESKFNSLPFFQKRKQFIQELFPEKPANFPNEWSYCFDADPPREPVYEAYAETAVFCVNRIQHMDVLQTFYNLNYHHRDVYQYVHGDKELLWISFLLHGKEFTIHPDYPGVENGKPLQSFGGERFYV